MRLQFAQCLSEVETFIVVHAVLSVIAHLHKLKIVHYDIKSENILFTANGVVKVCDFGLSSFITAENGMLPGTEIYGTANYISPEIANQRPHSYPTDI